MKSRYIKGLILAIMVIIGIYIFNIKDSLKKDGKVEIAVIIKFSSEEEIENMKQGFKQATKDLDIDFNIINSQEEEGYNYGVEEIVNNNIEGILMDSASYNLIKKKLQEIGKKIPIVFIEEMAKETGDYGVVSCDNLQIGKAMGEEVFRHGNTRKNILILDDGVDSFKITQRKNGILQILKDTKNKVIEINEEISPSKITEVVEKQDIDVVVALDTKILKNTVEAIGDYNKKEAGKTVEIYGIGSSNHILNYLENDKIISAIVEDEFSIGYLGIKNVLTLIKTGEIKKNLNIKYEIIDGEHMYSEENQRLLFPFIE